MTLINQKPIRAVALISGGLDSMLAAYLIKSQGIEVIGLYLVSPFGCHNNLNEIEKSLSIKIFQKEKGEKYLNLVESPQYGYGKNMNPCIDCRIYMFDLAVDFMKETQSNFIITGEVVGQRPMSQQKKVMHFIDETSSVEDLIVRPLSAKILPLSLAEKKGWVKRESLLGLSGRGRNIQIQMAKDFGLKGFTSPGGGCLLTESEFSKRLKDFFDFPTHQSTLDRMTQSQLIRIGRQYRLSSQAKMLVSRNDLENQEIDRLSPHTSLFHFSPEGFLGPVGLGFGEFNEDTKNLAGALIARHSKARDLGPWKIRIKGPGINEVFDVKSTIQEDEMEKLRI